MKKIIVSLTAASLIVASAVAADKGIDVVTTGQAAVYYQTLATNATGAADLFDRVDFGNPTSKANVGVQLNLDADLKNDFTFGSQITYLGTNGLEKNLVGNTMANTNGLAGDNTITNQTGLDSVIALTQINVSKKIANTTVKLGRQELPMALSPLAFSEDWSVFKNTFEAALVVNSDIPDTTLVGAYVGKSNNFTDMSNFGDMQVQTDVGNADVTIKGAAYMITAQNKSLPMTTVTASYYTMANVQTAAVTGDDNEGAAAAWGDVAIADKSLPMGLSLGLQGGQIMPEDSNNLAKTTALGVKASIAPIDALTLTAAYTTVDGDDKAQVAIRNVANTGTSSKTPLYTQMIGNQDAISLDANTIMLKAAYSFGDYGTVIAQGSITEAGESNFFTYNDGVASQGNDFTDLELAYVVKAAGVNYFAGYVHQTWADVDAGSVGAADAKDIVRLWARYNF